MVKGVSRRVIVVDSPDPNVFEQAIFILRGDGGVSQQQVVEQARQVAKSYARTHSLQRTRRSRIMPLLWTALGSAIIGAAWVVAALL